ncbi:uncharacterized protein LOC132185289 [Corylus avellana]|uniref:uncharacterized protein LOC132185289 n=1 Tax=Corylus avellana TaxID=13451 RepID=UPI00286C50F8|nr:uncharacterized protein LOC132185289 [Corylus avellana]
MEKLLERLNAEQMQLVAMVARLIWLRRNSVVFGGDFLDPSSLLRRAQDQVEACIKASQRRTRRGEKLNTPPIVVWQKPPVGCVKLNWDAGLDIQRKRTGIGVIVRDHEGKPLAMLCASKRHVYNPTMAKAIAACRAVELAVQLDLHRFISKGDALVIVQALRSDEGCWSLFGQVVNDARDMLNNHQVWEVQHVSINANDDAHRLAKMALTR